MATKIKAKSTAGKDTKKKTSAYKLTYQRFKRMSAKYEKYAGTQFLGKNVPIITTEITGTTKSARAAQMRAAINTMQRELNKIEARKTINKAENYRLAWDNYVSDLVNGIEDVLYSESEDSGQWKIFIRNWKDVKYDFLSLSERQRTNGGKAVMNRVKFKSELNHITYQATFTYNEATHNDWMDRLDQVFDMLSSVSVKLNKDFSAFVQGMEDYRKSYFTVDYTAEEEVE